RRQQADVGLSVPSLLRRALAAQDADRDLAGHDRHAEEGLRQLPDARSPMASQSASRLSSSGARDSTIRDVSPSPISNGRCVVRTPFSKRYGKSILVRLGSTRAT